MLHPVYFPRLHMPDHTLRCSQNYGDCHHPATVLVTLHGQTGGTIVRALCKGHYQLYWSECPSHPIG